MTARTAESAAAATAGSLLEEPIPSERQPANSKTPKDRRIPTSVPGTSEDQRNSWPACGGEQSPVAGNLAIGLINSHAAAPCRRTGLPGPTSGSRSVGPDVATAKLGPPHGVVRAAHRIGKAESL
jgi:hypothetical protein